MLHGFKIAINSINSALSLIRQHYCICIMLINSHIDNSNKISTPYKRTDKSITTMIEVCRKYF